MPVIRRPLSLSAALAAAASFLLASASGDLSAQSLLDDRSINTSVDRSFDPSPKDCADVNWSQAALRAFPSIGEACQGVEQRNGKTYVKLEGEVEEASTGGKRLRVEFADGGELTFTPTPNTTLYLDGQRTSFAQVDPGMKLNFYIPEDRLQAELQPDPNRLAFVIVPLDVTMIPEQQQSAASNERDQQRNGMTANRNAGATMSELPDTAGALPLIALGGGLLLLLGGAATLTRKLRK